MNHRPLGYEPNELPDCSIPQCPSIVAQKMKIVVFCTIRLRQRIGVSFAHPLPFKREKRYISRLFTLQDSSVISDEPVSLRIRLLLLPSRIPQRYTTDGHKQETALECKWLVTNCEIMVMSHRDRYEPVALRAGLAKDVGSMKIYQFSTFKNFDCINFKISFSRQIGYHSFPR